VYVPATPLSSLAAATQWFAKNRRFFILHSNFESYLCR